MAEQFKKQKDLYSNDCIAHVLAVDLTDQSLQVLEQLLSYGSLEEMILKFGSLSQPMIKKYCKEIIEDVDFVFGQGLAILPLKASNILISSSGRATIDDVGIIAQVKQENGKIPAPNLQEIIENIGNIVLCT